jgi:hypothetical protein
VVFWRGEAPGQRDLLGRFCAQGVSEDCRHPAVLGFGKAFSPLRDQPLEITRIEQNSPADPYGNQANPQSIPFIRQAAWLDSKGLGGLRKTQKLHISSF